jgi:hypothetical protein
MRIFAPSAALLVFALAWTGFWFFAADRAGDAVDVWLKREARNGRVYDCSERRISGFPFRIELECANPTAKLPGDGGEVTASAPRFVAVAQVYDPKRLIGELTGPVEITGANGSRADLSFALAQASVRIEGERFERGSIAVTAPRLVVDQTEIGTARSAEAHLRRAPDGEPGAYDIAAALDAGVSPALDMVPLGAGPVTMELQARATGLDDLRPRPTSERLKAFAEAGGRVKVAVAKATRGDVAADAKGDLWLDVQGRANGALDVTARGIDGLVKSMLAGDEGGALSSLLGAGAKMLGRKAELDGRPATTYRLAIDKGRVSLGPIRLTRLPPAF